MMQDINESDKANLGPDVIVPPGLSNSANGATNRTENLDTRNVLFSNGPVDEVVTADGDSGSSSPEPPEPWSPRYTVSISDKVTKDGAAVTFTIIVGQNGLTVSVLCCAPLL